MINGGTAPLVTPEDTPPDAAILAFSASSRHGSYNQRLLGVAVEAALSLDAEISVLDLRDLDLPVYDPDVAAVSMPQGVLVFRQILSAHDGLLISTPQYNGSIPPILKNALDWSSCDILGAKALAPYRGKIAGLMSASQDASGGTCCLDHLRSVLSKMGVLVIPDEVTVRSAATAFEAQGLQDRMIDGMVRQHVATLVGALRLLQGKASSR